MSTTLPIIFLTVLLFATSTVKATDNYNDQVKCGGCPCNVNTPCDTPTSPPPPPPPTPSPPPPPTPSPPPPPTPSPPPPPPTPSPPQSPPKVPTPTPGQNCPPPPSPPPPPPTSGFRLAPPAYINYNAVPPPGDIYPVVSSSGHRSFFGVSRLMTVFGLMCLLI